jgi:hypothetical protein
MQDKNVPSLKVGPILTEKSLNADKSSYIDYQKIYE